MRPWTYRRTKATEDAVSTGKMRGADDRQGDHETTPVIIWEAQGGVHKAWGAQGILPRLTLGNGAVVDEDPEVWP